MDKEDASVVLEIGNASICALIDNFANEYLSLEIWIFFERFLFNLEHFYCPGKLRAEWCLENNE